MSEYPCGGPENAFGGCQEVYPMSNLSPERPICLLCKACRQAATEPEKLVLQNMPRCASCGVYGERVQNPCGTCKRKRPDLATGIEPDREAAASARRTAMSNRPGMLTARPMREISNTQGIASGSISVGAAVAESDLDAIRSRDTSKNFVISYDIRRSSSPKTTDAKLGSGSLPFYMSDTVFGVREALLAQVNARWTSNAHEIPLTFNEVELRFKGNQHIEDGTEALTLERFYAFYNSRPDRATFIPDAKASKNRPRGSFLAMEIFILEEKYYERVENDQDDETGLPNRRKRKSSTSANGSNKRHSSSAGAVILQSSFERAPIQKHATGSLAGPALFDFEGETRPLSFSRVTCGVTDEVTGTTSFAKHAKREEAIIAKAPLSLGFADRGRSKHVFALQLGDDSSPCHVAKALFNIGKGKDIDISTRWTLLCQDLERTAIAKHFADQFFGLAADMRIEVKPFSISDAFVIATYKQSPPTSTGAGSTSKAVVDYASSPPELPNDDDLAAFGHDSEIETSPGVPDMDSGVLEVYLVEPRRSTTTTTKFTGTTGGRRSNDMLSATMNAFAHFVIDESACKYMLADIQGSLHVEDGRAQYVLFDLMSHTPAGDSGLGDLSFDGFDDFVSTHTCSQICKALNLHSLDSIAATVANLQGKMNPGEDSD